MRRAFATVLVSLLAALGLVLVPASPGSAADPLTGRLVDSTHDHGPVVGAVVRLRALDSHSQPGAIVDTDRTDARGRFRLDAGARPDDEYYVQVVAGRFQGGYVGGSPLQVAPTPGGGATFGPHSSLGRVLADPAFISGRVVDSGTLDPVRDVTVVVRSGPDLGRLEGRATTNRRGHFAVRGIRCEDDCALILDGRAVGHERGYFWAFDHTVVPTWAEAAASPLGRVGRVLLDPS